MTKLYLPIFIFTALTITTSCKKPFKCICAGGVPFEQTEKEVLANNSKKAKEICEADNQPPTSPDIINCGLE